VLRVWRVSQLAASEQAASDRRARRHATAKQLVSGLLVLNVVESAPQTSVCAVIYTSTKDRNDSTTTVHILVDIDGLPQSKAKQYSMQPNLYDQHTSISHQRE